jgi:hypothetical protein
VEDRGPDHRPRAQSLSSTATRPVARIVSGGQSGADRAALDVALALGLPCGGWCPRGRRAEDGPIPVRYPLAETTSANHAVRTRHNVRDSDGTLIVSSRPLTGGTALTRRCARRLGRPCLVVTGSGPRHVARVRRWLDRHSIHVLNVAGPRASRDRTVAACTRRLLRDVLGASPP